MTEKILDVKLHGKLRVGYIDGQSWRLYNPVRHRFKFIMSGKKRIKTRINHALFYCELDNGRCVIPKHGTLSNFASVPRFLRKRFPPVGDGAKKAYGHAAVIHDELYRTHEITDRYWKVTEPISRAEADIIFRKVMKENGVKKWTRWLMYHAVKAFGKKAWNKGGRPLFSL